MVQVFSLPVGNQLDGTTPFSVKKVSNRRGAARRGAGLARGHRVQERQRDGDAAGTAQQGPARQRNLRGLLGIMAGLLCCEEGRRRSG